jgi:hypothetical protein
LAAQRALMTFKESYEGWDEQSPPAEVSNKLATKPLLDNSPV